MGRARYLVEFLSLEPVPVQVVQTRLKWPQNGQEALYAFGLTPSTTLHKCQRPRVDEAETSTTDTAQDKPK